MVLRLIVESSRSPDQVLSISDRDMVAVVSKYRARGQIDPKLVLRMPDSN